MTVGVWQGLARLNPQTSLCAPDGAKHIGWPPQSGPCFKITGAAGGGHIICCHRGNLGAPYCCPTLRLHVAAAATHFLCLGVLVQVSAKRSSFADYVQQQLAARLSSPLVWMVVAGGDFSRLRHYLP